VPQISFRQALNDALRAEMRRDPAVVIIGEDVAGGAGGTGVDDAYGGIMGVTRGLIGEFGRERVIDTPITESAIVGMAAGAALTGLRPVAELMFVDFVGVCLDQILNQVAKFRYMFGGNVKTPLVIRAMFGAGFNAGAQHSQCLYSFFTHVPGLKVVIPSTPYDAKGLLIQAIRDDDPVVFLEHTKLYDQEGEVPSESYAIPFGEANVLRDGGDVTIVALARMVHVALKAADLLASKGVEATVIDPRSTSPLDEDTILDSLSATGRLVIVDESNPRCSVASEIAAVVAERAFRDLKAPIRRVTAPHTPVPFSPVLEEAYIPSSDAVVAAALDVMGWSR
jgi:acetoin:2,6-dichlorophenolindophenol oxidoreductase subunit beta